MTDEEYHKEIYKNIKEAQKLTSNERKELLKLVHKKPETVQIITTGFKRDPNVVAEVLEQANGICNYCKNEAPFFEQLMEHLILKCTMLYHLLKVEMIQ